MESIKDLLPKLIESVLTSKIRDSWMQIIKENPYRTLGLLVGATAKERERQIKILKRQLEAEQELQNDYSFPILGKINRTIESVSIASATLNLERDKMNAALFWFYKGNQLTDEPVFDLLKEVGQRDISEIWGRLVASGEITTRNSSAFHNLSTYLLCVAISGAVIDKNLLQKGIILKLKFIESIFISDLKNLATDSTYNPTIVELEFMFLNQVQLEVEKIDRNLTFDLIGILAKIEFEVKDQFLKQIIQKPVEQIESDIKATRVKRGNDKSNTAFDGNVLYQQTSVTIGKLKSILGSSGSILDSISDKVSEEILLCGLEYFIHFRDSNVDPSRASMDLFVKAKSLAIGNIVELKCQENIANLQEWIVEKPQRELQKQIGGEVNYIIELLNLASKTLENKGHYPRGYSDPYSDLPFEKQPQNLIESEESTRFRLQMEQFSDEKYLVNVNLFRLARDIVKKSIPKLKSIKATAGADEIYMKLSNDLAAIALACLIEYVNNSRSSFSRMPPNVPDHVIETMNSIGGLDMKFDLRKRHNEQKQTLIDIKNRNQANASWNKSKNKGCYIATMAYGDYNHPQVLILRQFRDDILDRSILGRLFIKIYYKYSIKVVEKVESKKYLNDIIRKILNLFIWIIE